MDPGHGPRKGAQISFATAREALGRLNCHQLNYTKHHSPFECQFQLRQQRHTRSLHPCDVRKLPRQFDYLTTC